MEREGTEGDCPADQYTSLDDWMYEYCERRAAARFSYACRINALQRLMDAVGTDCDAPVINPGAEMADGALLQISCAQEPDHTDFGSMLGGGGPGHEVCPPGPPESPVPGDGPDQQNPRCSTVVTAQFSPEALMAVGLGIHGVVGVHICDERLCDPTLVENAVEIAGGVGQ